MPLLILFSFLFFLIPMLNRVKNKPLSFSSSFSKENTLFSSMSMEIEEAEEQNLMIKKHDSSKEKKAPPSETTVTMRLASLAISFNVRLKSSDMPIHMQEHALRYTRSLIIAIHPNSPNPVATHLARALKKEFDLAYGVAWHCVIGKSFGSFVSHTGGGFVYFSIDSLSVLLFKTELQLLTQPPPP